MLEARMEVKLVVTLVALMLFCISNRGNAGPGYPCNISDLSMNRTSVPGQRGRNPSYLVTLKNRCNCTQTNITLDCPGFNWYVRVKPVGIVTANADKRHCTFHVPVKKYETVSFYYTWSSEIIFAPVSSNISCSAP